MNYTSPNIYHQETIEKKKDYIGGEGNQIRIRYARKVLHTPSTCTMLKYLISTTNKIRSNNLKNPNHPIHHLHRKVYGKGGGFCV
jgi:hypothetical protein